MSMKPTDDLKDEHKAIKRLLKVLDSVSKKLKSGENVDAAHLPAIVDFIRAFADKCHHGKEEGLLFPAMIGAGIPGAKEKIGAMLKQHTIGRGYVKAMGEAASGYKNSTGDKKLSSKFAENASNYVILLGSHIEYEDTVLFPLADKSLAKEKQKELMEGFEEIEEMVIGRGRHDELHMLLENLESAYLRK